jgi:hypothetical protein
MLLYLLAMAIGIIVGILVHQWYIGPSFFQLAIMENLKLGRRVMIVIDDDVTIFEMNAGRIRISRGVSKFEDQPYPGDDK